MTDEEARERLRQLNIEIQHAGAEAFLKAATTPDCGHDKCRVIQVMEDEFETFHVVGCPAEMAKVMAKDPNDRYLTYNKRIELPPRPEPKYVTWDEAMASPQKGLFRYMPTPDPHGFDVYLGPKKTAWISKGFYIDCHFMRGKRVLNVARRWGQGAGASRTMKIAVACDILGRRGAARYWLQRAKRLPRLLEVRMVIKPQEPPVFVTPDFAAFCEVLGVHLTEAQRQILKVVEEKTARGEMVQFGRRPPHGYVTACEVWRKFRDVYPHIPIFMECGVDLASGPDMTVTTVHGDGGKRLLTILDEMSHIAPEQAVNEWAEKNYPNGLVNLGTGRDLTEDERAAMRKRIEGFKSFTYHKPACPGPTTADAVSRVWKGHEHCACVGDVVTDPSHGPAHAGACCGCPNATCEAVKRDDGMPDLACDQPLGHTGSHRSGNWGWEP